MKKEKVLARMKEDCLVAVVRAKNLEQGEKVVDAIMVFFSKHPPCSKNHRL